MRFQETVQFIMRIEPQQSPQVRVSQAAELIFLSRKRFERAA